MSIYITNLFHVQILIEVTIPPGTGGASRFSFLRVPLKVNATSCEARLSRRIPFCVGLEYLIAVLTLRILDLNLRDPRGGLPEEYNPNPKHGDIG